MNVNIAYKWIQALRSGKYKQHFRTMHDKQITKFCAVDEYTQGYYTVKSIALEYNISVSTLYRWIKKIQGKKI